MLNIGAPLAVYLIWAVAYYILIFCVFRRLFDQHGYESLYHWFARQDKHKAKAERFGPYCAPLNFMFIHLLIFCGSHAFALISFYNERAHIFLMIMWFSLSLLRGGNYYESIFAYAKYTRVQTIFQMLGREVSDNL